MGINKKAFDEAKDDTGKGIIEFKECQGQQLRKSIERKVKKTEIKLEPTYLILQRLTQNKRVHIRRKKIYFNN